MNLFKRILTAGVAVCLLALPLSACGSKRDQMAEPKKGEPIAIIQVKDYGEIKLVLFPDVAPKGVENFTTHAKAGYYDGLTFHRVIEGFMAQGGDPEGTGAGGESIWGEGFGLEVSKDIHHFNGAIAYAHSNLPDSNGSQFYLVDAVSPSAEEMRQYNAFAEESGQPAPFPKDEALQKKYAEYGGAASLDGLYTVFGQIYEGMDVLDKIMTVEKDPAVTDDQGNLYVPAAPVVIDSIEISTYE